MDFREFLQFIHMWRRFYLINSKFLFVPLLNDKLLNGVFQNIHILWRINVPENFGRNTFKQYCLGRYLLVQIQQWKHQGKVWNLFKVNNKDTVQWHRSGIFIANFKNNYLGGSIVDFEQMNVGRDWDVFLVFLLLTLNK